MEKNYDYKKLGIATIVIFFVVLLATASITIIIDPCFHYHKPLPNLEYSFFSEWYVNDGIVRHFDYDLMITGTSMTECFKTSEADEIFNATSIKVPYAGGSFSQINELVEQATRKNPNLKIVIRGLDLNRMIEDDFTATIGDVPEPQYLYNDNIFDDVQYVLNEDMLYNNALELILYTKNGGKTPTFDEYASWSQYWTFGKEAFENYERKSVKEEEVAVTDKDIERVQKNIRQNVTEVAKNNPNIIFYYFITPYNIFWFDAQNSAGQTDYWLALHKAAIEEMLEYENIKVYSFLDCYDAITNLDNYKDVTHYGAWVNSGMLVWMKNGNHLVTSENLETYYASVSNFYKTFDYDKYFGEL